MVVDVVVFSGRRLNRRIVRPAVVVREESPTAETAQESLHEERHYEQMDLFTDYEALEKERERERLRLEKEKSLQHAVIGIKKKFGKNAILKGTDLREGATARERNQQIGGHKS